jgi:hypothetical protein
LYKCVDEEFNRTKLRNREARQVKSATQKAFDVTSEQRRRKGTTQVDLLRDCCVKAYGLSEPESGTQKQAYNLSGTAGIKNFTRLKGFYRLGRVFI